jgi:hypothetical protein
LTGKRTYECTNCSKVFRVKDRRRFDRNGHSLKAESVADVSEEEAASGFGVEERLVFRDRESGRDCEVWVLSLFPRPS